MMRCVRIFTIVGVAAGLCLSASGVQAQVMLYTNTPTVVTPGQCVRFTRTLNVGFTGDDVRNLQQFLIRNSFLAPGYATGYYGELTAQAVKKFQTVRNISTTGRAGPNTRARITAESCSQSGAVSTAPTPTKAPTLSSVSPKTAAIGETVTLIGKDFDPRNNTILFGSIALSSIASPDGKKISFTVPDITTSCPTYSPTGCDPDDDQRIEPGTSKSGKVFRVYVSNQLAVSNSQTITVESGIDKPGRSDQPSMSSLRSPSVLQVNETGYWTLGIKHDAGKTVIIRAVWGDDDNTRVDVGRFTSRGSDSITVSHKYRQSGRFTPRFILVDDVSGTSASKSGSRVTVSSTVVRSTGSPKISSVSPKKVKAGEQIMIVGSGFSSTNNTVFFGPGVIPGVEALNNGTTIFLTVPYFMNPCTIAVTGTCTVGTVPITPNDYRIVVKNSAGNQTSGYTITVTK